jgi:SPP1 gp7 family putative phage head morphogenesis protein
VQIDLAAMAKRANKTRRPTFQARAIMPTRAQENRLLRLYMRVVREWQRQWLNVIRPQYESTLAEPAFRDSVDDVQGSTDAAANALNRLVVAIGADLGEWIVQVEKWHRGQFGSLFSPIGVNLNMLLGSGDVSVTLQSVLNENLALIRSLNDQMRNGISGAVFRGLTQRLAARDVAREIRRVSDVGQSRSELIAADQIQKLTGRLDQERQQQVGVKSFVWLHSHKKYPRPWHLARDGQTFAWDSTVAKTDPPGFAIRCGCRAQPVLELDKVG